MDIANDLLSFSFGGATIPQAAYGSILEASKFFFTNESNRLTPKTANLVLA